jgi:hypothetical protein
MPKAIATSRPRFAVAQNRNGGRPHDLIDVGRAEGPPVERLLRGEARKVQRRQSIVFSKSLDERGATALDQGHRAGPWRRRSASDP